MTPPYSSPHPATPRPPRRASERFLDALRAGVSFWPVKLTLLALTAWGGAVLWNWVTTESVAEQRAGDTSSPIQIENLKSFVVRQNGQRQWEIAADNVKVVDGGDAWVARNVTRGILYRDDKPWISMTAPRVRLSNLSKNLDAVGGVKATGPDNFSFQTPQARWLAAKKLVEIPGQVEARLREMEFSAPTLFYQWERGELECPGKVEVRVKGGVLRGKKLDANLKSSEVKLNQDVELIFVPGVAKLPRVARPKLTSTASDALGASPNMSRSRLIPVALTLAATGVTPLVLAQTPAQAQAVPSATTAGNVVIRGASTSYSDANGVAVLSGGVTVSETGKEFSLSASDVIYSQPKNQATASGDLKVETRNSTIRGAKLFGDFNKKLLSITGNVVISAYDKGDGMSGFRSSAARKPVRIACNRLDWNYATRQATLVGNLRIVQADNSGTCNSIVYDEPKNIVYLKGNVRFGNAKRQQFVGDEVTISVDKGLVSAPNVTIRSGLDGMSSAPSQGAPRPTPRTVIPNQSGSDLGGINFPEPPPPIESLVPPSKPMVRRKPALPPLPAPKTDSKESADADAN